MFNNNLVLFKLTLITKDILLDVYESNPDFIYLFPHIVDNNSFSSHLTSMIIILNFK
jgi:ABC-type branched-subunit amino acid transport system substrate-binding protein